MKKTEIQNQKPTKGELHVRLTNRLIHRRDVFCAYPSPGQFSMHTGGQFSLHANNVSVQSQADTERAALKVERIELQDNPKSEHHELTGIYIARGLDASLAKQVAAALMAHDALVAHARDELGITEAFSAKPLQAAFASALNFSVGALFPLLVIVLASPKYLILFVALASLFCLALLGGVAAKVGGAEVKKGVVRVTFWSALAMGVTASIGAMFGTVA